MKLNYKNQLRLTVALVIVSNMLNTLFRNWVFSSVGKCLCGLLWIIHPVMPGNRKPTPKEKLLLRLVGVVLILWGIFSRSYLYH